MINRMIKVLQEIMRKDAGVNGNAQRIEQIAWILFLKVYDAKEKNWEATENDFKSFIPEELRWRNWAIDNNDGKALTGDELLDFVNNKLFPTLKNLTITEDTKKREAIVQSTFEDNNNYMKDGISLRQVINTINAINFEDFNDIHAFGDIYESILRSLQNARDSGEFYTPRVVTDFMVEILNPKIGESIADFACGTGGFLISALKKLDKQAKSAQDRRMYNSSIYGIEKKALPFLLCSTNLLLNDVDSPNIIHGNALEKSVRDYKDNDKFDIILMNPPYGGKEQETIKNNFPKELRSGETADLFISLIMYRLKQNGRCAVIMPEGFLFGTDESKVNIKKKLINEFNLHTIIRLPRGVFAPYSDINTNILFFEKKNPTKHIWFYRIDLPQGYTNFSKTKPMKYDSFEPLIKWWKNREEIIENGIEKVKKYTVKEIQNRNYNLDLCGFSNIEEVILTPNELIKDFINKKEKINNEIDVILEKINKILYFDAEGKE